MKRAGPIWSGSFYILQKDSFGKFWSIDYYTLITGCFQKSFIWERDMDSRTLKNAKEAFAASKEFQRTISALNDGQSVLWDGCIGSSNALIGGEIVDRLSRPLIVVISKTKELEGVSNDFAIFTDSPVYQYPFSISFPDRSSEKHDDHIFLPGKSDLGRRLKALEALDLWNDSRQACGSTEEVLPPILVTTLSALAQPVPTRKQVIENTYEIKKGDSVDRDKLTRWLVEGGFSRLPTVEFTEEFSVRGDVIDIYAVDWDTPVRINFFGDVVESIYKFDIQDQRSLEEVPSVHISRIAAGGVWVASVWDRIPQDCLLMINEPSEIMQSVRQENLRQGTLTCELMNNLYSRQFVVTSNFASRDEPVDLVIHSHFSSVDRFQGNWNAIAKSFQELGNDECVFLVSSSENESTLIRERILHSDANLIERVNFLHGSLGRGFGWSEDSFLFITLSELLGKASSVSGYPNRALRRTLDSFLELTPGDYVIHIDQGLALYRGIKTMKKANQIEDHLMLEFADHLVIYIPVSRIGKIQKYVGSGTHKLKLAKYNGKTWVAKKEVAQKAIWKYANEMLMVEAARNSCYGIEFPPDGELQKSFESLFPYHETQDQLKAVEEIKRDMESSRPMDRLLCGDVGFGKTEVALRAAFKAVEAGYQVAVLAPTTVLTEQHYRTFCNRTSSFPIHIASLSRYVSPKDLKETIEKTANGEIDILIGTHRLLSKDVSFKKLGLIIIDEEQKFGVVHKERLKQFKSNIDLLTMTATPIPRTLHFSLLGIREISNLETPPLDRLPVETRLVRFNEEIIREAIERELKRGGQVCFVHNYVSDIFKVSDFLKRIVPEARVEVAYAQKSDLEDTMRDFVIHNIDVLVTTTIVESGLDIPNVNTILVNNADRFGLAELHQLRGRVGRSKRQAYCYLMLKEDKSFDTKSLLRLNAIVEHSRLGAGFQIAMRDLEIRGTGNILGKEQSGHLEAVGYEMYCDMLEACVRALKSQPQKLRVDVDMDLPVNAFLSQSYIEESTERIDFYRRIDRAASFETVNDLIKEMRDRFGRLPVEASRLFQLSKIRIAAFRYRVKKVILVQMSNVGANHNLLEIEFRSSNLKERLLTVLQRKSIELRLVDELGKGYVSLPPQIFSGNGGEINPDNLLNFVYQLFEHDPDQPIDEVEKHCRDVVQMQLKSLGKSIENSEQTGEPLKKYLKRGRKNNNPLN